MRRVLFILLIAFVLAVVPASAQLSLTALNSPVVVDFETFTGTGFAPMPAAGQLDSDTFSVTGMSDGACAFGATCTAAGDFARGASTGTVTTGGIYSFDIGAGDDTLGVQPGGSDMTPGEIIVRVDNNTGNQVDSVDLSYNLSILNNAERGNSFNAFYGFAAGGPWTALMSLDETSPAASDANGWVTTPKSTSIMGLAADFQNMDSLYIRFLLDDVSGSGSRDEFGLDDLTIEATSVPVELMGFSID